MACTFITNRYSKKEELHTLRCHFRLFGKTLDLIVLLDESTARIADKKEEEER